MVDERKRERRDIKRVFGLGGDGMRWDGRKYL